MPVEINPLVAETDLTIGIGACFPHNWAGFGGGSKIIMPGICGVKSILLHHLTWIRNVHTHTGNTQGNLFYEECNRIFIKLAEFADEVAADLAAGNASGFDHYDALRTGGRWREELGPMVAASDAVLLFRCHHALTSYEMRKEFTLALDQGKDVVPLLLGGTPLPSRLAAQGCIDFRGRGPVIHEGPAEQREPAALAGQIDRDRPIQFTCNGRSCTGFAGDTLASALLANGVRVVGRSFKRHRPRGILSAGVEETNALFRVALLPMLFRNRTVMADTRERMAGIVQVIAINLAIGVFSGLPIDNWGHIGGLVGGLALGWFATPLYRVLQDIDGSIRVKDESSGTMAWVATLCIATLMGGVVYLEMLLRGRQLVP